MESKETRSSVIARSMRFNGLFQPLHQEKLRAFERQNKPKVFIQKYNSGFTVVPTKELCRVYLQKPNLLASKGIIDAQAKPPHYQTYGEMANHRKFGRRFDQQNLNLKTKLRHRTSVDDPLKPKIGKKENSPRRFSPLGFSSGSQLRDRNKGKYIAFEKKSMETSKLCDDPLKYKIGKKENTPRRFSPLGFGIDSQLRDWKKGQYITLEKKANEMKKLCDGTTFGQRKDRAVREVGSKLMVSISRDSVLSLERNRFAEDVKFKHKSSSNFVNKDENAASSSCSNASPGCQTNAEEAHQPSPVSVLEPIFNDNMSSDSEELSYLDFHGVEKQLDALKSESDSYSDGSGMEVSSDEESVIASDKESKDSEPIGLLDTEENRDSSYIDDILAEVLLMDKNWVADKRDSLDSVITFKVFEKMEKKYYTETSWKRSERRILFDRVNLGLVEILESFTATPTWKKPVSRRLGAGISTFRLKQELCKVLARQEKRAKKESFEKVPVIDIDEWLELEADDEPLVCDLESMIVDELLSEVVSFM